MKYIKNMIFYIKINRRNKMEIEKQLNKLLQEYNYKVIKCKTEINVLLIDFAKEYNKIWRDYDNN
jgi:hypothetical protein